MRSAGLSNRVPLRSSLAGVGIGGIEFKIEGREFDSSRPNPRAEYRSVSPEYFGTLDISLVDGRLFDSRDQADSAKVAIISERMAKQHFEDRSPIGSRIRVFPR